MIKYTIVNKPKSAEIFSSLRTTGTPTMPEPISPHVLSLYSSSLQHIPLSKLLSILTWATAQRRGRSRTQDQDGSFVWDLPHPPALTHPLSTSVHVFWMKISAPRAVYSPKHHPHPLPVQLWHQDLVVIQPIRYYTQRSFPVACFQGFVFLIFPAYTFHQQGTIITIIIYYSDCSSSAHRELSLLLPSSHLLYKMLHRNTDKK